MHRAYLVAEHRIKAGHKTEPGTMDGETVSAEYVASYTAIEARRFFIDLGGSEEMRKTKAGVITVKSTNPDRTECRVVRFTPVSGNGGV